MATILFTKGLAVLELLKHKRVDVNHQDNEGNTASICASKQCYEDIIVELLKIDKVDGEYQNQ